jgi:hypothetical protein
MTLQCNYRTLALTPLCNLRCKPLCPAIDTRTLARYHTGMEHCAPEAPPRLAPATPGTMPPQLTADRATTDDPICYLTGITHGELGRSGTLLIGPEEAIELGLLTETTAHAIWLCGWCYSELRFHKPHAKAGAKAKS